MTTDDAEFPETTLEEVQEVQPPAPVRVSGDAQRTLSNMMRMWSGWPKAEVNLTQPPPESGGFFAATYQPERKFYVNVDALTRNPNRVLRKITPFRMRQEAVLTGAMLHEAGHARHSHWRPRTADQNTRFKHGFGSEHEGEEVNKPTHDLATLCEEPRIEGLINRNAGQMGALGLPWTMRAMAAWCYPMTNLSDDPDQAIMDVIASYTLRAGRIVAANHWVNIGQPDWLTQFQQLLHSAITQYLGDKGVDNPAGVAAQIMDRLHEMYTCSDDTGTFMVDKAREVLDLLYPETDPDDCPSPSGGCGEVGSGLPSHPLDQDGDSGEGDQEGAQAQGNSDPDDPGQGDNPGAGDTGEGNQPSEVSGGTDTESKLAKALAQVEQAAETGEKKEAQVQAVQPPSDQPPVEDSNGMGAGSQKYAHPSEGTFRNPTPKEREVKAQAEKFLRGMIDPTVTRRVRTSASPSSSIDAAAYAAWKANGQRGEPAFFRHIQRTVTNAPPIKIAVLRDVSASMAVLTKPSALLSWSIAAAAFDLRNFAGRGVQIESCFINWGSDARVICGNGEMLRGIFDSPCDESTSALEEALGLVEAQMPGFFDVPEDGKPVSRLIVHFTDWQLGDLGGVPIQAKGLLNGVKMLTVAPTGRHLMHLPYVVSAAAGHGVCEVMRYNPRDPGEVWTRAMEMLG